MNLFKRLWSLARKAPAPRFPKNKAEYEAARKRYLNTYGKLASYAVARTERGPLDVLVEGTSQVVIAVNNQPLTSGYFGLTVQDYVRRSFPAPSAGPAGGAALGVSETDKSS